MLVVFREYWYEAMPAYTNLCDGPIILHLVSFLEQVCDLPVLGRLEYRLVLIFEKCHLSIHVVLQHPG